MIEQEIYHNSGAPVNKTWDLNYFNTQIVTSLFVVQFW